MDDAANKTKTLASQTITYDNSAPNVGAVSFTSVRQHTDYVGDCSSDVCSSDLVVFSYAGSDLAAGERFQYSVDGGTTWTNIAAASVNTSANTVTISEIGRASCRERE